MHMHGFQPLEGNHYVWNSITFLFLPKLLHTLTKKYLYVSTTQTARTENTNLRVRHGYIPSSSLPLHSHLCLPLSLSLSLSLTLALSLSLTHSLTLTYFHLSFRSS